ncbi:MAG: RNB domain-containing ribonuclease [Geminocystis sp.]|nr:RNB domain-containing ribonuclease [Geminocystis sp.]HIK38739.1 RNB domain-containing ribonuclease [Geminocystis sp. M7585_C2015_104]MCS7148583.1 RNB domain-containing ribonuclease [Geminocystis sp.]MCX8078154.1 RNB domain-containing ribonuclease [Geminocystis sp.]MDW8115025.1 RNB domain-containing ribonuclease [Geminocystis sp.]
MKTEIKPRKFREKHLQQAYAINLADYYCQRLPVFGITIDDSNTMDRDDGIWLKELEDGKLELQVSITDVASLIPKDSPIDIEAKKRVITLYHTNPPTPMLPSRLSNDLASLEENKERLAITLFFRLNNQGDVESFTIRETIFTNKKAFSYEEVEKILNNPQDKPEEKLLVKMQKLAKLLALKRGGKSGILTKDGYIDEDGNLIKENANAYQMIAEFMILTNRVVANFLATNKVAALYRTQDVGIEDLELAIKTMGHCLVPAVYDSSPRPHVGLGLRAYTHFTSPLRRFVDLVNHRILKNFLNGQSSPYSLEELSEIAKMVNEFQSKFKIDKSNYMREKKRAELEWQYNNLSEELFKNLSQGELSDLIQYIAIKIKNRCCQRVDLFTRLLELRRGELQTKDYYYIWFVAGIDKFFDDENVDAVSVLLVKSQLEDSVVEYKFEYCELRKKYFAYCYIDGKTTVNPEGDARKNRVKHKAALAAIKSYIRGELTDKPNPIPPPTIEDFITSKLSCKEGKCDIKDLEGKDFSKLIEFCLKTQFDSLVIEEINRRIKSLTVKDLYNIWFVGRLRVCLDDTDVDSLGLNAVSVVLTYSQKENLPLEFKIEYSPSHKQYYAHCYINNLTHPYPQWDSRKNKAKQKASLAYIKSYLENTLTNNPQAIDNLVDTAKNSLILKKPEKPTTRDWVSKLHQLCQKNNWQILNYRFISLNGIFSCVVSLELEGKSLQSQGYGRSKKEAKQCACRVFLIQHQLLE